MKRFRAFVIGFPCCVLIACTPPSNTSEDGGPVVVLDASMIADAGRPDSNLTSSDAGQPDSAMPPDAGRTETLCSNNQDDDDDGALDCADSDCEISPDCT